MTAVPQLLYIVGVPGAGKSTLVAEVTRHAVPHDHPNIFKGCAVTAYKLDGRQVAVELGRRRPTFSGTDALSMSVLPRAVGALEQMAMSGPDWTNVFAEGDRLATMKFFDAARTLGWEVQILHLKVSDQTAAFRRAERGSTQNEGWLRGRITKVANLVAAARQAGYPVLTVTGEDTPADLVAQVARVPVLGRFTEKVS